MLRTDKINMLIGEYSTIGNHPDVSQRIITDSYILEGFCPLGTDMASTVVASVVGSWRGHNDQEEKSASEMAIQTIIETFEENDSDYIPALLNQSFISISQKLSEHTAAISCALVVIANEQFYMANCGDCRVFLSRGGEVRQISVAHTFEEKLIEAGRVTLDELKDNSLFRYPMLRALGFNETDNCPDLRIRLSDTDSDSQAEENQGTQLYSGDMIILCTGSIFQRWRSREEWGWFQNAFSTANHPQEAIEGFISLMREKYSYRGFTVIALQIP
jgi:serine/threonine protein phosphatase PrpC